VWFGCEYSTNSESALENWFVFEYNTSCETALEFGLLVSTVLVLRVR
jgi:hypothetical protein